MDNPAGVGALKVKPSRVVKAAIEAVRGHIASGNFAPGSALPAELDLAVDLSVSRGTIRRVIELLVESGELSRRPHARPVVANKIQNPNSQLARDVYVWISRPIADDPSLRFIKGISQGLAGTPFRMVVREPSRFVGSVVQSDERHFFLELLDNDYLAGAIIERDLYGRNEDVMRQLVERGIPVVFADAPPPAGVMADYVGATNAASARTCVEHLLDLGHSRIACVVDSDVPLPIKERIKGYWRALSHARVEALGRCIVATNLPLEHDPDLVFKALGGEYARAIKKDKYFADYAYRAAREVLAMNPRPTALFVGYDVLALWVAAFLEGAGVRIPADISIVGFDWLAGWDRAIPDTLTTAAQDFQELGLHAANLLIDRMSGDLPPWPRYVLLNAPLVVRSSTAPDLLLPSAMPATETRAMQPVD